MLDELDWEKINNAKLEPWQKTGSDYAIYAPDESKKDVKPAGEWNTSRILFTSERAEYWAQQQKNGFLRAPVKGWGRAKKQGQMEGFAKIWDVQVPLHRPSGP